MYLIHLSPWEKTNERGIRANRTGAAGNRTGKWLNFFSDCSTNPKLFIIFVLFCRLAFEQGYYGIFCSAASKRGAVGKDIFMSRYVHQGNRPTFPVTVQFSSCGGQRAIIRHSMLGIASGEKKRWIKRKGGLLSDQKR
jgi:hypothetical protein